MKFPANEASAHTIEHAANQTQATQDAGTPGANMLLLDYQNVLIQSVLTERLSGYAGATVEMPRPR